MEKNKGIFPFRKHPVGDFHDGKKGRKRKGGRLRRSMGFLLAAALIFNTLPASGLAVSASEQENGLCEHHRSHTAECGYAEAQPCTHEHGEECYKTVTECVHEHTDECYPETEATEESTGEGDATTSDAGNREPSLCTHVCSEESGCITKILDCHHEHDESCGYQEAQDCGYVCEICNGTEPEDTEDTGTDTAKCICETLCTEDSINGDCPVCRADGASLLDCKGKAPEENTENQEDTGICKHHQEHDADCGYIPKSEDEEGSPCTYECRVCPIEDLIAALPEQVTEDNADDVRGQLDHILDLYRELDEGEQEEIDLSRVTKLQEVLDAANAPMAVAGEININSTRTNILTAEAGGCPGHTFTGTTAMEARIYVESGVHNVTFSGLNITAAAKVGVAPGATMNLTIEGTNTIKAGGNAGIYVPKDATLVITDGNTGTLEVSSSTDAGIGGAVYAPDGVSDGDPNCGTVIINGGTITATGGKACAGIGGGSDASYNPGNGGTVIINGGTVTATGGSDGSCGGAGIGGSTGASASDPAGNGGTLTINGGHVTLTPGAYGTDWGAAYGFGQGSGSAPGGTCELTLADASYLDSGTTLDPNGKYTINGDPTEDMIVVPELVYTGEVLDTSGIKIDDSKTGTGTYFGQTFTVNASKDGWVLQDLGEVKEAGEYTATFKKGDKEISKTFTVAQSDTDLKTEGKVLTYNGDIQTTTFNADDTITVKATPTATGTAPQKAAARLRSDYTAPTEGQMALFVGDVQVSEPVQAGEGGTYTMTVSAADVLLQGNAEQNGNAVTLTAKFVGNDNMADAAGTVDVRISAVAKAELDGKVIGYYGESNLADAFEDSGNADATFTLLADVERTNTLTIKVNCTLDLGGHNITFTGTEYVWVQGLVTAMTIRGEGEIISEQSHALVVTGSVTLEGGTFTSNGGNSAGVYVNSAGASLSVTGEHVTIRNTGGGYGLAVNSAQSVQLSAGTYKGEKAVSIVSGTTTLGDLLDGGCAYHSGDTPIALEAGGKELTGTVTVKACTHTGEGVCTYAHNENTSTHTKTCLACGYTETGDCGFEKTADPTADSHTGQCPDCKRDRSGAHSFSDWAGNPVARTCTVCGYEQTAAARVEKDSTTTYVGALADALTDGNSGATVTLLSEVDLGSNYIGIRGSSTFTLDLNGQTVKASYYGAFDISDGSLTIQDSGTGGKIESSNITIKVTGGTLSIKSGTVSGYYGVQITRGTVNISGGVISGTENGLWVNGGGNIVLSGGAYSGRHAILVDANVSVTLKDLLAARYAYHQNDIPVAKAEGWVDNDNIGEVPLDTKPAWLTGTVTVKECSHTGEGVCTYTHNENTSTHTKTCLACGQTLGMENCTYTFSGTTGTCSGCGDSVTVGVSDTENLVYDGTGKEPGVTVMRGETALTAGTDYTVAYTDNKNAGENKATVGVTIGNGQGTYIENFSIGKATLYVAPNSQTIRYGESIREGASAILTRELATGDHVVGVTLTPNTRDVPGGKIIASEVQIQNESGADVTGNYEITYVPGNLTINPAQGTLTVPAGPVTKTFGDGQFLLGCSTNGDGKISYASSDENVASVSADGNVLIKGAGETVITVSLAAGTNYTGAESQEVRITVAKEAAPAIPGETRNYTYLNGSHGAVTIDVAGKLPKDRGETTYTAATTDGKGILSGVSMDQDGNLVYTVEANKAIGDTAVITVTAVMANYEDTAYNVTIKLVEKKTVEPQDGGSVSVKDGCILIYGQTLSDLTLENVIFVEQGTQKQVEGTLAWSDPSHVPEVADRTAQWVFTPKDNKEYEQLTGTAAITVVKATPETEAPEAAAVTYHPAGTLGSVGLNGGGAAWTVGGSAVTVEGTWGWKEPSAIPAVKNSGYTAVFTPKDTANYDTVERTVAVTVAKAEPYIATPPTAAQITYGDTLDASTLTDGTVQYSSSDSTAVTGSFAWKDGSIKPDSGSAAYTVVFTPADSTDYSSVETQVTLVTGKAENAPDMPPSAMDVARRFEKVGDVGLPEGWQWQDTDRDTALETGVPVTATAVYTGADRDNYRNVTVSVAITRADCDHEHTETRNAVTATCQRKGYTGDTWCLNCGELLAKGTETDLADHSGGTATCISGKVCQVCGTEYTGKDSANHMHTEIRGAIKAGCTSDGYTGDTYCTDCGAKTDSGRAVPAAGHDWHVTGEEAATTTSEGRRIYTCGECGQTREESIPKLPQPSHTHSYSPRETKAATCRSNGVITYSCSCGDSYTQNTAALGHSYRSEVTKQPTVSAEGVMTYTCGRCGHSYTRPIAKLPDTGTQQPGTEQPGTQQPGDTEPGSGSAEETRPDTGIPFIKDEDGKTGWDVIRAEEEKAREGSTINVDMNGTTVVPGDIFDSIKGRDITITFDMGNGILWSVDGKSITGDVSSPDVSSPDKAGDIDFSVKTETNAIPADIVNNVTGERYSIQISLAHEGEFGFTAVLSIGLGRENAGYTASLYYYNESTGELEFICKDQVAEDGAVSFAFTHASDYVIAIDGEEESGSVTESAQPEDQDADSTGASEESPQTGQAWRLWWLIVAGTLVIIMGIGVFFVVRKKGHGE